MAAGVAVAAGVVMAGGVVVVVAVVVAGVVVWVVAAMVVLAVVAVVGVGVGGLAGDQDPGDRAVTSQTAAGLGIEGSGVGGATHRPGAAQEGVQVDGDRQLGPDPAGLGSWPASRGRRASSHRASARRWLPLR